MNKETNIKRFIDIFNLERIDEMDSIVSGRTKTIIEKRYGLTDDGNIWTLSEIGGLFNFSRERIRQILNKAKYDLRKYGETKNALKELKIVVDGARTKYMKDLGIGQIFRFVQPFEDKSDALFACISIVEEYPSLCDTKKLTYVNLLTKDNHNHCFSETRPFELPYRLQNIVTVIDRESVEQPLLDYLDTRLERKAKAKENETKNKLPLREWLKDSILTKDRELNDLFKNKKNRYLLIKLNKAGIYRASDLLDKTIFDMARGGFSRGQVRKILEMIEEGDIPQESPMSAPPLEDAIALVEPSPQST